MHDQGDQSGPRVWPRETPSASKERPRMRTRWIIAPSPGGWSDVALSEWELERAGWADRHPHTETNLVLEGHLHVECDGKTVVAGPGDTVQVPGGAVGRYWAPEHARMVAVYGPNPGAEDSDVVAYWHLDNAADPG